MITELNIDDEENIKKLEKNFSHIYNEDQIVNELKNNPYTKYLIYTNQNEELVGFLKYDDIYERFEISYFEVVEKERNKGIGSKLLEHLIKIAKNKKIENITLEVREKNEVAITTYKKYNFYPVAIRKNYYGSENGILMKLDF